MIALPVLLGLQRAAQRRVILDTLAMALPFGLAMVLIGWRLSGAAALPVVALFTIAAAAAIARRRARRFDRRWLIAQLDASVPAFEDSSALLFEDSICTGALARLQRDRLETRIAAAETIDLRPAWSRRNIIAACILAGLAATSLLVPAGGRPVEPETTGTVTSGPVGPPQITGVRLRIIPPAYTGLPAREQQSLSARMPAGSRVEWTIALNPSPSAATLFFPEDGPVRLQPMAAEWSGSRMIDRSMLYRIEAPSLPRQRLQRLDAVADAPPVVRLVAPKSQLELVKRGQNRWNPVFEAADDYEVAKVASLRITVTKGDGENITYQYRSIAISGRGDARRKRFAVSLDLSREGLAPGGDMIVQLVVSDNRSPNPQEVEGPSAILRWPAPVGLPDGLDGMAVRVMPAYFRSQRQIIIDAEALVARRRRISADEFLDRSNTLGSDQAQLRMRYGQFMGEEAVGGGTGIALPTNDAPPPTTDAATPPVTEADTHGHDAGAEPPALGKPGDPVAAYGHAHDSGDAATLFDPGTRSTLSRALDAMWSSERALRQGKPEEALPAAYLALEFLKEAQQASRIFLGRTSSVLPTIDFSRRMSGKREGIVAADIPSPKIEQPDAIAAEAWRALQDLPGKRSIVRIDALERWVRSNAARLPDPLGLIAAIDTMRSNPGCSSCRRTLGSSLWTALERPPATVRRRALPEARGRRYLGALK